MCCLLVSGFLTEITQQIHSLRASCVISSHFARAAGSEMRTFRKSGGTLCTAPGEIAFLAMGFILNRHPISWEGSDAVRMRPQRRANLDKHGNQSNLNIGRAPWGRRSPIPAGGDLRSHERACGWRRGLRSNPEGVTGRNHERSVILRRD